MSLTTSPCEYHTHPLQEATTKHKSVIRDQGSLFVIRCTSRSARTTTGIITYPPLPFTRSINTKQNKTKQNHNHNHKSGIEGHYSSAAVPHEVPVRLPILRENEQRRGGTGDYVILAGEDPQQRAPGVDACPSLRTRRSGSSGCCILLGSE